MYYSISMSDSDDPSDSPVIQNDTSGTENISLTRGRDVIRQHHAQMPTLPGVYRMLDAKGAVLYVGKAKNLRNRVNAYTQIDALPARLQRMVMQTASMEVTITRSEAEALLLEATLIRHTQPRYNILLRDDKSFPYIHLTGGHAFPRITKHRGAQKEAGDYFGPFVSASAVNETITTLQKAFLLRPCSDAVFKNRSRPCLQYQIKRCSAPCVGRVTEEDYAKLVREARQFLTGESRAMQDELQREMDAASEAMDYEKAAILRDRIRALNQVQNEQQNQIIIGGMADIIALYRVAKDACIMVSSYRGGRYYGGRTYFPAHVSEATTEGEMLEAFIGQFYQSRKPPADIYVSHLIDDSHVLEEALALQAERKVNVQCPIKGNKRTVIVEACKNAQQALKQHLAVTEQSAAMLKRVAEVFGLDETPMRIEVFDNSHVMGTHPVSAMIVAGAEGFRKNAYRKFNLAEMGVAGGDDYGMMRAVLRRRLRRLKEQGITRGHAGWPDLILLDGGQGQLNCGLEVLEKLGLEDIKMASIAKGPDRNAGNEQFFLPGHAPFRLRGDDPALHYLQRLRDEAHRFAIGFHRDRRSRAIRNSGLDEVPSIGPRRRRALLAHFGSVKAITGASVDDLARVSGISPDLAQRIYDHFHGS